MTYRDDPLDVQVARLRDRLDALEKRPALSDEVANERERCARDVERYADFMASGVTLHTGRLSVEKCLRSLARRLREGDDSNPGWKWST